MKLTKVYHRATARQHSYTEYLDPLNLNGEAVVQIIRQRGDMAPNTVRITTNQILFDGTKVMLRALNDYTKRHGLDLTNVPSNVRVKPLGAGRNAWILGSDRAILN